ncbi:uncharacterized protein MONBRDRAFT_37290 [Monosiga brevicollis MX1]|uniref:Uncharacterized protein n=1 Tax=Monosiga brevicollis TaxID=81824 RepID=A9V0T8_MONBE|nr:uncharacterized protein MONBRDRAFT_37290 [Monosiga brevicollis MX1]EDQ88693.1 predicted protein [Monosiga brevicollis MX1]|eukprot:XP_001746306.1 hypothetical protein [Monosiga brevicollis MX1]
MAAQPTPTLRMRSLIAASIEEQKNKPELSQVLAKAGKRAMGGGAAGAAAMGVQVVSLLWLRTIMNYQYRNGGSLRAVVRTLYAEGGVLRFYQGLLPALAQGPLARFGDTAANAGTLALLDSYEVTASLPVGVKTVAASGAAAFWRVFLMPIDTCKTIMQVEGKQGLSKLGAKIRVGGPGVLYHGALAAMSATFAGHYPWFATFNILQESIPQQEGVWGKFARNAGIGFCASVVSDTVSNSIRVTKVAKQAATESITYMQAVKGVIAKDGIAGLMFRGLQTRILANGLQGMMFSVVWKALQEQYFKQA